jgi:SAM-dependent methyltransferase
MAERVKMDLIEPAQRASGDAGVHARVDQPEWLDLGRGTQAETCENLREMDRLNGLSRGKAALLKHLAPRLRAAAGPVRVLDLGSGAGSLPRQLARWSQKQGLAARFYGVDWSPRNLACAGRLPAPGAGLVCADACRLPFPPASMHYAISTLFMHHFSPPELAGLLRAAAQVVTHGLVMADLVRGWPPLLAFKLIQPIFARSPLTRHDGALSIRRAYLPAELLAIARSAGLEGAKVYATFPWQMTLVVDL